MKKKSLPVVFNMATMPSRIPALQESVPRMLAQCDELHVYLNEFSWVPKVLIHPKITLYHSSEHLGDLGDVGKFYNCKHWIDRDAWIFTVDDKLLYPPDYVSLTIAALKEYNRRVVLSYHGRNLKPNCRSYYWDPAAFFGVLQSVPLDHFAHELGTGAMAMHSKTVEVDLSIFPHINMTDIYFSMHLQRLSIPILIRRHPAHWVKLSRRHDESYSIHAQCNGRDELQTQVVNGFRWQVHTLKDK